MTQSQIKNKPKDSNKNQPNSPKPPYIIAQDSWDPSIQRYLNTVNKYEKKSK